MPSAFGQKFHYDDHDTDQQDLTPPVLNQWYEVFHAYDVRHLWFLILQTNDETVAKTVEVRWTIDGQVYFVASAINNNANYWGFRNDAPSGAGTAGLSLTTSQVLACWTTDKRGKDYKVEIRITSPLGTNQRLYCNCVRETLDLT